MGWSVIRQASVEDRQSLERKAEAFCRRHGLTIENAPGEKYPAIQTVDTECDYRIYNEQDHYLKRLWLRIVRRLFRSHRAEGIAGDTIGYHAD